MLNQVRNHPLYIFKDFRKLFIARLISAVGDKFFTISLAWLIVSNGSESSKVQLGIIMAVNMLPIVLFGPFMGTLADRLNRKACLIGADIIRTILIGILAVLIYTNNYNVYILCIICFFTAIFTPLFESCVNSSLVDLTDREHISKVVALDSMTVHISSVLGAFLGSVLIALIGVNFAFLFNAASFLVSSIVVLTIKNKLPTKKVSHNNYKNELKEGFRYLSSEKSLLYLVVIFTVVNFFSAPLMIMIPMIVKFTLNSTVTWTAIFEGVLSIGSLFMAIVLSFKTLQGETYKKLFCGMIFMGFSILFIGMTSEKYTMCLLFFTIGVCLSLVNAIAFSIFQKTVPDYMKGRFFAILTTASFATIPLAYMINSLFAQYMSLKLILIINGALTAVVSLWVLFIPKVSCNEGGEFINEKI